MDEKTKKALKEKLTEEEWKALGLDDEDETEEVADDSTEEPDDTETTPDTKKDKKSGGKSKEFKPITSQEEFDSMLFDRMERLKRSVRATVEQELKDEASIQAAKEQGDYKKLYEKAQEKLAKLEGDLKTRDLQSIRAKVAKETGLPESMIDRLRGETEDELMDDAKKLVKDIAPLEARDIDAGATTNSGNRQKKKKDEADYKDPSYWGLPT